jgi:hypothetical protein
MSERSVSPSPDAINAAEPSRILFQSTLVQVGEFRCP